MQDTKLASTYLGTRT